MKWRRKRVDLAERLRPYVNSGPPPERLVDADPIRMFLFRWMIETGDPIDVLARGFDLPPSLVHDILQRRLSVLPRPLARELAERFGIDL